MNSQSTNIFEMWNDIAIFTGNAIIGIDSKLQEQTSRLDAVYNNLLLSAQNEQLANVSGEKLSKRQSKAQNGQVGDLFSAVSDFQLPAVPPVRRTRRQASIAASNKDDNKVKEAKESIYPISTRASRARASSTFIVGSIGVPTGNSTFVDDKKVMGNIDTCISPQMFPENDITYIKPAKSLTTKATKKSGKKVELIPDELSPIKLSTKIDIKNKSEVTLRKNKPREKLEDIDVNNIEEPSSLHLTRTMKRKLLEENQINAKKINLNVVPLTQQISTPKIPPQESFPTPHQIREIEAEKRKELHLKNKADQSKFDSYQLKVAKQRKFVDEKLKKAAEEKRIKEEKLKIIQKEKEIMMKEEALKKQKQAELKLAEINAKRIQSEKAKLLKMNCKIKKNEIKTKTELKSEKTKPVRPKTIISNLPVPTVSKEATLPKSKIEETGTSKTDYGLDISARDSSEDEAGPKKPVPTWAKRENRVPVLEAQYFVDSTERDLFFNCPKTLSLKAMFKGWNFRDKQRTSSAVWNTPPRYSEYIRKY